MPILTQLIPEVDGLVVILYEKSVGFGNTVSVDQRITTCSAGCTFLDISACCYNDL
ncbi:MAG TPA: hypothetical protein V6D33_03650 [Cyanophyceae cyanobacterium]